MRRRLLLIGIAAAAIGGAAVALALLLAGEGDHTDRRLVAEGAVTRRVAPDVANVRLGVTARAGSARQAMDAASSNLRAVIAAVRRIGVDEVRTEPARLGRPPARPGRPVPTARPFVARQAVTVRLRRLERTGRVIDAAVAAGATDVAGPAFALDDPRAARRVAVAEAVADARRSAAAMAEAAGLRLTETMRLAEGPVSAAPATAVRGASDAAPPIVPGTIVLRARVTVTFAAEPI